MASDNDLSEYIKKSKETGISDELIQQELLKVGWKIADIDPFFLKSPLKVVDNNVPSDNHNDFYQSSLKNNSIYGIFIVSGIFIILLGCTIFIIFTAFTGKTTTSKLTINNDNETIVPVKIEKPVISTKKDIGKKDLVVSKPSVSDIRDTNTIQNANSIIDAENKVMEILSKDDANFVIVAPLDDILEPGRKFTLVFTPVKSASKYEISISTPHNIPGRPGLVDSSNPDILLKQIVTSSTYTITVPESKTFYTSEHSYGGEELTVKALDSSGTVMKISPISPYSGKRYEVQAIATRQIKILSTPTDEKMLGSDKYVLSSDGGEITLTFGKVPPPFVSRKIFVDCYDLNILIDSVQCPKGDYSFKAVTGEFTKKLTIKGNRLKGFRDTAFDISERLYDASGKVKGGLDDSFSVSIKLEK